MLSGFVEHPVLFRIGFLFFLYMKYRHIDEYICDTINI